jgi:hypothetical protein
MKHRTAARWFVGLLMAGTVVVSGIAPATADTGWNGTLTSSSSSHADAKKPQPDTGWNGT